MSLLDQLSDPKVWNKFYTYKESLACPKQFTAFLRRFIDEKRYLRVCAEISAKEPFPLPSKSVLSKLGQEKKRIVYTYPEDENTVLKLLTHLMLRKYDGLFAPGLYSFRPGRTAKDAVRFFLRRRAGELYAYKTDVHDYFNSAPTSAVLETAKRALADDGELYGFLERLYGEEYVLSGNKPVREQKGMMAGTPLSAFLANLYLSEMDGFFAGQGVLYARYSDDVLLFAPTQEELSLRAGQVRSFLDERGLTVNPNKEEYSLPGQGFTFLGFSCKEGVVDIAPATVLKLKGKMRRKRDALARWCKRTGSDPERAAAAFLRTFRRKLLESPRDNELSWSRWFFPVINTDRSLRVIDRYAQDCLRYLLSGSHTKARYSVRYEQLKRMGYQTLVQAYYASFPKQPFPVPPKEEPPG